MSAGLILTITALISAAAQAADYTHKFNENYYGRGALELTNDGPGPFEVHDRNNGKSVIESGTQVSVYRALENNTGRHYINLTTGERDRSHAFSYDPNKAAPLKDGGFFLAGSDMWPRQTFNLRVSLHSKKAEGESEAERTFDNVLCKTCTWKELLFTKPDCIVGVKKVTLKNKVLAQWSVIEIEAPNGHRLGVLETSPTIVVDKSRQGTTRSETQCTLPKARAFPLVDEALNDKAVR